MRVRWAEVDRQGIVFNGHYLTYFDIGMRCARIGNSSMLFLPEIYRGDELLVSGELVYVNADPVTKKPAPVPEFLREAIQEFEVMTPIVPPML